MRTGRVPMSYEEYDLLPFHPGWKNEYYGGTTWITPRHAVAIVRTSLVERLVVVPDGCRLEPISPGDTPALIRAFKASFRGTSDFWHWGRDAFGKAARESIETFFSGKRGVPHPATRIAVLTKGRRIILGAALIIRRPDTLVLDLLMVRPNVQRHGLATALAQSAANALLADGETKLESGFDPANDASNAWHRQFGFEELPNLLNSRLYWRQAQHKLRRREAMGDLSDEERRSLAQELTRREAVVEDLERISEEQSYEAVSPVLRQCRPAPP